MDLVITTSDDFSTLEKEAVVGREMGPLISGKSRLVKYDFIWLLGCPRKLVNGLQMGYNPLTEHLLTSWDILVDGCAIDY